MKKTRNIFRLTVTLIILCSELFYSCEKKEELTLPVLSTVIVSEITQTSAISGGNISKDGGASITARGVCWSTDPTPTIDDSITIDGTGSGSFISHIGGLIPYTDYYICAYATNSIGTAYGNEISFRTIPDLPKVTTSEVNTITATTAVCGGSVTNVGGDLIVARGVCWSTAENPTLSDNFAIDGAGSGDFESTITGLTPATSYHIRAYATNGAGTAFGGDTNFITIYEYCIPELVSPAEGEMLDNACTDLPDSTSWLLTWNDCLGATLYNIYITGPTSTIPLVNAEVTGTHYHYSTNSGYIINQNRLGWKWKVRAFINEEWGEWSDERLFDLEPVNTDCFEKTVIDFEGNIYATVPIGGQLWMAENLKSTTYNDGVTIPNVTSSYSWINLITDAYCWYKNNASTYKDIYGALYNWYAVNTGKLCPDNWHVPSDAEWLTMINLLGGEDIAGGKLKEAGTAHWISPNTGATNESGFTALPSGNRIGGDGGFYNLGGYGCYWSSNESSETQAIDRVLVFDGTNFRIGYDNKTAGFSVRCVKNQ